MFIGHNYIGFTESAKGSKTLKLFSTVKQDFLPEDFSVATDDEIDAATLKAAAAFDIYKKNISCT